MDFHIKLLGAFAIILCGFPQTQATPTYTRDYYYRRWAAIQAALYYSWDKPELPDISKATQVAETAPQFHGRLLDSLTTSCDKECQMTRSSKPNNKEEMLKELQYETLDLESRMQYEMSLDLNEIAPSLIDKTSAPVVDDVIDDEVLNIIEEDDLTEEYSDLDEESMESSRKKREIFDVDTRFTIPSKKFLSRYPFAAAVKVSTGCSGVMVSPRHVLTSAHCVHDGERYIKVCNKFV